MRMFEGIEGARIDKSEVAMYQLMKDGAEAIKFKTAEEVVEYIKNKGLEGGVVVKSEVFLVRMGSEERGA